MMRVNDSACVMPAITLWRPWALWVAEGWKTIETRLHDRFKGLDGKRIAIHAGLKWDKLAITAARVWLTDEAIRQTYQWESNHHGIGKIVATARVSGTGWLYGGDEHSRKALIDCQRLRFGLYLDDIQKIDNAPRIRGGQGIFRVTLPIIDDETPEQRRRYIAESKGDFAQ